MEIKNIMVPYDGSESAMSAVLMAEHLAEAVGNGKVTVLSVLTTRGGEWGEGDYEAYRTALNAELAHRRREVDDELAALGVPVDFYTVRTIASPTPTQGILDYAEVNDVDLIVMGNRGMGKLRGALGSVSYGVLHRSDVPVLIMK